MSLFNKKYIGKQIAFPPTPDQARVAAFKAWSADIASGKIASHSEISLHGPFVQTILVEALGYSGPIGNAAYNVTQEKGITRGSVDVAIGAFENATGQILAPFELKGADTKNLDAIMPGRAKTPVDQAWKYATNNVGSKWVLVSNYLEIRLYSYGEGRQAFESFDLARLHEPEEFARIRRRKLFDDCRRVVGGTVVDCDNFNLSMGLFPDARLTTSSAACAAASTMSVDTPLPRISLPL